LSFSSPFGEPTRAEPEVSWGPREVVLGVLLALGALVVSVAVIALPAVAAFGENSTGTDVANAISQIVLDVLAVAAIVLLVRQSGGTLVSLGLRRPEAPRDYFGLEGQPGTPWAQTLGLIGGGVFASYVAIYTYVLTVHLLGFGFLEPKDQIPEDFLQKDVVVFFLAIGVVIVAPICEELFFRGFMFAGLRRAWGFFPAAVVSGLIFASAHTQLGLIIPFAVVGFILAFLYQRTRSIFVSMGMHFVFNLISFSLLLASR
jgi:membrane protease YdiL (CAAX protease family)